MRETLETYARGEIQRFVQRLLEEEVDELLGRKKSERRTEEVGALLPELYLHGLSLDDFDLALRGLLDDTAPLSPSSILRLKQEWQEQYNTWKRRDLSDLDIVYLWVDGTYVKAGLEKIASAETEKECERLRR